MRLIPLAAALLTLAAGVRAATVYDDDFADGVRGPQWAPVTDNPAALTLAEQGGRLQAISNGTGVPTDDALYLSTFRLSTAANFSLRLDYLVALSPAGSGRSGDTLGLVFGVGRDLDGTDSAAIGVGYANVGGSVIEVGSIASRTDDVQTTRRTEVPLQSSVATVQIDYDAATDRLTLGRVGSTTFRYTLVGVVRASDGWAADSLYVSFGGRGSGFDTTNGVLNLDNFQVLDGTVVPEPASAAVLGGLTVLAGLRLRVSTR